MAAGKWRGDPGTKCPMCRRGAADVREDPGVGAERVCNCCGFSWQGASGKTVDGKVFTVDPKTGRVRE